MPSSVQGNQIPTLHSIMLPKDPLHIPRVFGSTCFVQDLSPNRDNCLLGLFNCLFLGILEFKKDIDVILSPSTHCLYVSTNVTFSKDTWYTILCSARDSFYRYVCDSTTAPTSPPIEVPKSQLTLHWRCTAIPLAFHGGAPFLLCSFTVAYSDFLLSRIALV